MRCSYKLNRDIMKKFSALKEENKAIIIETLIESLFGQAAASFDRWSESGVNP